MASASFKLDNMDSFLNEVANHWSKTTRDLARAIYQECELIMTDSKENYCPVDEGVLRSSGFVEQPIIEGNIITVQMGYGGPASDYALIQHERLDFHHRVGSAKYLEIPALNAQRSLAQRISSHMEDK